MGVQVEMVFEILLSVLTKRQLRKLPEHIVISFQNWVEDVEERGLEEVRKIPGYHDEPLKGSLDGIRSVRLSRSYRAYYRISGAHVKIAYVERIDKHEY